MLAVVFGSRRSRKEVARGNDLVEDAGEACIPMEYCPLDLYQDLRTQIEEIRRLLNGYITWLKNKKVGENEAGAKLAIRELPDEYFVETK